VGPRVFVAGFYNVDSIIQIVCLGLGLTGMKIQQNLVDSPHAVALPLIGMLIIRFSGLAYHRLTDRTRVFRIWIGFCSLTLLARGAGSRLDEGFGFT
jgi:hypothetical protein